MKIQTKLNKVQASQISDLIDYTGLDLNTIVRVALQEYYQRHRQAMYQSSTPTSLQSIASVIPAKPLDSLDNSPPMDSTAVKPNIKLTWSEWSMLNPGKSNDEFLQYFLKGA